MAAKHEDPRTSSRSACLDTLQLDDNATEDDIKSAFKRLAYIHHPIKNSKNAKALQRFIDLCEAYLKLKTQFSNDCLYCCTGCEVWPTIEDMFDTEEDKLRIYQGMFFQVLEDFVLKKRFQSKKKKKIKTAEEQEEEVFYDLLHEIQRQGDDSSYDSEQDWTTDDEMEDYLTFDEWLKEKGSRKKHRRKRGGPKRPPSDTKPKALSKKQLLAQEHKRKKEMEEIGKELLEHLQQNEKDVQTEEKEKAKMVKEKNGSKNKVVKKESTPVREAKAEIEKQQAEQIKQTIQLESKLKLTEEQEKKQEKKRRKKERKKLKKQNQEAAKQTLQEQTAMLDEPQVKHCEEDLTLEPLPKMVGNWREIPFIPNLPPRLQKIHKPITGSESILNDNIVYDQLPSPCSHTEYKTKPEIQESKSSFTPADLPIKVNNDVNEIKTPDISFPQLPVREMSPSKGHDPELTSHHLQQYKHLMKVQPERHTQWQLKGMSDLQRYRANLLKRQREKEAERNREEIAELMETSPRNIEESNPQPCGNGNKDILNEDCEASGFAQCKTDNQWFQKPCLIDELRPQSVEEEEAMIQQALALSVKMTASPPRKHNRSSGYIGTLYKQEMNQLDEFPPLEPREKLNTKFPSKAAGLIEQNKCQQNFSTVSHDHKEDYNSIDSSYEELPEGAFSECKPCPYYTACQDSEDDQTFCDQFMYPYNKPKSPDTNITNPTIKPDHMSSLMKEHKYQNKTICVSEGQTFKSAIDSDLYNRSNVSQQNCRTACDKTPGHKANVNPTQSPQSPGHKTNVNPTQSLQSPRHKTNVNPTQSPQSPGHKTNVNPTQSPQPYNVTDLSDKGNPHKSKVKEVWNIELLNVVEDSMSQVQHVAVDAPNVGQKRDQSAGEALLEQSESETKISELQNGCESEDSTSSVRSVTDIGDMSQKIQNVSNIWPEQSVNDTQDTVFSHIQEPNPNTTTCLPGFPLILPDNLALYMQYLMQQTALAMMATQRNPTQFPSSPLLPGQIHSPCITPSQNAAPIFAHAMVQQPVQSKPKIIQSASSMSSEISESQSALSLDPNVSMNDPSVNGYQQFLHPAPSIDQGTINQSSTHPSVPVTNKSLYQNTDDQQQTSILNNSNVTENSANAGNKIPEKKAGIDGESSQSFQCRKPFFPCTKQPPGLEHCGSLSLKDLSEVTNKHDLQMRVPVYMKTAAQNTALSDIPKRRPPLRKPAGFLSTEKKNMGDSSFGPLPRKPRVNTDHHFQPRSSLPKQCSTQDKGSNHTHSGEQNNHTINTSTSLGKAIFEQPSERNSGQMIRQEGFGHKPDYWNSAKKNVGQNNRMMASWEADCPTPHAVMDGHVSSQINLQNSSKALESWDEELLDVNIPPRPFDQNEAKLSKMQLPKVHQEPHQPKVHQEPHQPKLHQEPHQPKLHQEPHQPKLHQEPHQPKLHQEPHQPKLHQEPHQPKFHQEPHQPKFHQEPHQPKVHQEPHQPKFHKEPQPSKDTSPPKWGRRIPVPPRFLSKDLYRIHSQP